MNRRNLLKSALLAPFPAPAQRTGARADTIRKVEAIPASVPYRSTFVIGRGLVAKGGQGGTYIYVRVESESGLTGWGETISLPAWSYETPESIVSTVEKHLAPIVVGRSAFEQAYFQKQFDEVLTPAVSQGFPFAKAAVQIATLDLAARAAGLPVHRFLGGRIHDKLQLTFAISIDKPEAMAAAARSLEDVKCFKVKVAGDPWVDADRVRAVAKARPDADLWLDANQSYRPIHLETFLRRIDDIERVRCLEQPVKSTDWLGLKRSLQHSRLPLAVDEGCFSSYDVARLARMDACDLVVLKVAKSAGLWGCQRSATVADANGLGLLGSGLSEAGIGFAASVHLYSTMDLLLPVELNGPRFLAEMFVDGLEIRGNTVTVPDGPGLGIAVKEDAIRAHALKL